MEATAQPAAPSDRFPLAGLLALATAAFITILTEALPAGLLPQMSHDLGISIPLGGQLVTFYAIGSLAAAIPLTAMTQGWRRRPLLLIAIGGFAVVNMVTALSQNYALTLAARFLAGVSAGLLWALIPGHASRMVPPHLQGRAIAVAMTGTPLALSLGIPAGTLFGAAIGWRAAFGAISVLTLILIAWTLRTVPDFPGRIAAERRKLTRVFRLPGIRPILFVTLAFVLAHNMLYTYVTAFLAQAGLADRADLALFVFGAAALLSIWITGLWIDRRLRALVLGSLVLFALASLMLAIRGDVPAVVFAGVAAWGLAFGGAATLFQTASANAAGEAADLAQSMIVTVWNIAIAGGGLLGGAVLDLAGAAALPWALLALSLPPFLVAVNARRHGFPHTPHIKEPS